jgi:uncharacterized protein YndB with AHSA1/START domain
MNLTEVTVSQTIPAPVQEVFDLWMNPGHSAGPWFDAARLIWNPAVDALFHIAVHHNGRLWAHYGRFLAIERPHRVEHTWVSEGSRGLESIVTVTFEPRAQQTDITLRHSGVPDEDGGSLHRNGWSWLLSRFAEGFATRRAEAISARR